ncbi:MAG: transcription termination factor NusA [Anaerolineales bacterium]|nr:transcription termination factor NusA [Anaerolineales bacterium]MCX7607641.1 transcription termination factor NusA [Anaerolineales bacterium]MDW8228158.1 transcription termination factor NusA [Anaerolineales bacterium]
MKNEFTLAFNEMLEEKQLPKEVILQAIESAMVSAYRRAVNASNAQEVRARVDPETGKVTIFAEKEVVEEVQDERTEVSLKEAQKIKPDVRLGDMIVVESTPKDFGRVAAQTARQVIQQRIREAERQMQAEYFSKQIGEIISGTVQAVNATQGITVGLDMKAEGILPPNQKIPGERFKVHDRIRAIVLEVKDTPRGPQIILSRAHRNFLRRLLENEVPEIYHGIVEIRAIAREPGQRAKVAVSATQPNVDPVGACVGIRGVRIQAIVKELHDEKIDIIEWNPDPVVYISKAISPARVTGVYLNESERTATVVVQEDQLSLAIGRDGQNARLAAKLTGWRIDIKSLPEAAGDAIAKLQSDPSLSQIAEIERANIPVIEEILAKHAENHLLTADELVTLVQFVDRVERRTVEKVRPEVVAEQDEKSVAARASIPSQAFETDIAELDLPEHVYAILTGADYRTVGDLMLTMKLNPDRILGLPGIGPKAMQAIENALAAVSQPSPQTPAVVEEETVVPETPAALLEEQAMEVLPVSPQAEALQASETETEEEEDFERLFRVENLKMQFHAAEEETTRPHKGKEKKKSRKDRIYEYDEELGQAIARKKHKRGDALDEDW